MKDVTQLAVFYLLGISLGWVVALVFLPWVVQKAEGLMRRWEDRAR